MFKDKALSPQRSSHFPEFRNYWSLYPFRDKHSKHTSTIIFLKEDKKSLYKIKQENSPQNVKSMFSQVKAEDSEKYMPQRHPNKQPDNNRSCKQ